MDFVLKLRELRRLRGLTQPHRHPHLRYRQEAISSFETGDRIHAMTVAQLERLLGAYGVSLLQFFSPAMDRELAPWDHTHDDDIDTLVVAIRALPRMHKPSSSRS